MSRTAPAPLGVYVHWPYCARVCPYCDFNVVRERGRTAEQTTLAEAIIADLAAQAAGLGPRTLTSIFFGGGTPSLMAPAFVAAIIEAARQLWPATEAEITLEANPTDAEASRFAALADAGVNRLSLGVQSLNDEALRFLGRNHDATAARRAIAIATSTFPEVSIDLIYALPGQSAAAWARELQDVANLGCGHLSPYQLTLEPGTAFGRAARRGRLTPIQQDLAADLYETTQAVLSAAGFEAYEVSNHARRVGARSRHNLTCWRGGDYMGVGPGAHGRLTWAGRRWATVAPDGVGDYVAKVGEDGMGSFRVALTPGDAALERLLMGLRTSEGVPVADIAALKIPDGRLTDLAEFVRQEDGRLTATSAGRLVLDRVIAELSRMAREDVE